MTKLSAGELLVIATALGAQPNYIGSHKKEAKKGRRGSSKERRKKRRIVKMSRRCNRKRGK